MKNIIRLLIIFTIAFSLLNCPSAPKPVEKTPEEKKPVVEKPVEKKPEEKPVEKKPEEKVVKKATVEKKPVIQPVSDEEVREVRNAIARAEEADASYYDPDTIKAAKADLDMALTLKDKDPNKAREYLKSAKEKAALAFDNSVERAAVVLSDRMERMNAKLQEIEADKFMPDLYREAVAGIEEAKKLYSEGKLSEARDAAYAALKKMSDLYDLLDKRIRWVRILKRDTEQYLDDSEKVDAATWAPDELAKTNELYFKGLEAFQNYDLDSAEQYLGSAREAAKDAVTLARERKVATVKKKTEDLMLEVMKEIEEASKLTVVTEEGTVIEPEPWKGEEILKEEEKKQKEEKPESGDQSLLIPKDDGAAVLGDVSQLSFLDQAKKLWKLGVVEKNKGNYEKAMQYFLEAKRYIAAYKDLAVQTVYTVRLIPERRDCLWRIAEYDFIYGDPYLWPKIWRRNRKLIQNPDLIYPGWKLVIPPK